MIPPRKWLWYGLAVELFRPVVGATQGIAVFTESVMYTANGIYHDMIAHYNWLRAQDSFAQQVAFDLERLPEV